MTRKKLPINDSRRADYDRTAAVVTPSYVDCGPTFREMANHLLRWRAVAHSIPRSWTTARLEAAMYLREVSRRMKMAMNAIVGGEAVEVPT